MERRSWARMAEPPTSVSYTHLDVYKRQVQIAKGEIFICLDSDDYYIETALEIIYSYHLIHKDNPDVYKRQM